MRQPNWNRSAEYERTNERTTSGGRRSSSSMKTNQFVIKHEASKQRILDKIVIWHKIVQQRNLSISLFLGVLFWVNFVL
jgi:hypothetical protein